MTNPESDPQAFELPDVASERSLDNDQLVPKEDWHRLHPVSPAIRGWKVLAALMAFVLWQNGRELAEMDLLTSERIVWVVLSVILIAIIASGYFVLAWRVTRYAIDDSAVFLHQGVLFRKQRHARLDRIQAVDVIRPLLARVFGLSELRVDVAGGEDSSIVLAYLPEAQAQEVRNEILARAAGVRVASPDAPTSEGPQGEFAATQPTPLASDTPEMPVYRVSASRLVGSIIRSAALPALLCFLGFLAVMIGMTGEWAIIFSFIPMLIASAAIVWARFSVGYGFRAALAQDGIRLHHGLLETRAQTVPPGRIQAIAISQPLLWRSKDWWKVVINVAGYGEVEGSGSNTVLLPVGTRAEAILALWMVLPDLGTDDPEQVLNLALTGKAGDGFVCAPKRTFWLDPLSWRRNGYTTTNRALITRRGRFHRVVEVVPHERTQSLRLQQGPLERKFTVASFRVDTTIGPVAPRITHLDHRDAARLIAEQAVRAAKARAVSGPEKWLSIMRENPPPAGTEFDPQAGLDGELAVDDLEGRSTLLAAQGSADARAKYARPDTSLDGYGDNDWN